MDPPPSRLPTEHHQGFGGQEELITHVFIGLVPYLEVSLPQHCCDGCDYAVNCNILVPEECGLLLLILLVGVEC